jgi:hypothetical protein
MIGLTLAILVAAVVALIYRARIARAGRNAFITFLATCMRIGGLAAASSTASLANFSRTQTNPIWRAAKTGGP